MDDADHSAYRRREPAPDATKDGCADTFHSSDERHDTVDESFEWTSDPFAEPNDDSSKRQQRTAQNGGECFAALPQGDKRRERNGDDLGQYPEFGIGSTSDSVLTSAGQQVVELR
jgi:hypothetical protein